MVLPTLINQLDHFAKSDPLKKCFSWIDSEGNEETSYTYEEVKEKTDALASHLMAYLEREETRLYKGQKSRGDSTNGAEEISSENRTVLLVYPPSLHFIIAFLACLRCNLIAVPVFPPNPSNRNHKDIYMSAGHGGRRSGRRDAPHDGPPRRSRRACWRPAGT